MNVEYFNFTTSIAETRWETAAFLRNWRAIGFADRRWTPPTWLTQRAMRQLRLHPLLGGGEPLLIHLQAISRSSGRSSGMGATVFERPVAAAIVLPCPATRSAYLVWLQMVNHEEPWERLLAVIVEQLWGTGIERIIGSTGLSLHLDSGVLLDHFHRDPPLHTPYNPPFYPELIQTSMRVTHRSRLYRLPVHAHGHNAAREVQLGPATLTPFSPRRLAGGLLPLFQAACEGGPFPPPGEGDAKFLLQQLRPWPLYGWLARIKQRPVGFILLQADGARAQRLAKGGRNWLWRLWIQRRKRQTFSAGRILFGAVLPEWRSQGIGRQLVAHAITEAQRLGWQALLAGPHPPASSGAALLARCGASPQQSFALYEIDL